MRARVIELAATVVVMAMHAACVVGQTHYEFINIVSESSSVKNIDPDFSMNSSGLVAFQAIGPKGQTIFTGKGGPLTTVVDSAGPFLNVLAPAAINDAGTVAFVGIRTDSGKEARGIYTITGGGPATPIVEGSAGEPNLVVGWHSINAHGAVAFVAGLAGQDFGVHKGNGGPVTTIASRSQFNSIPLATSISATGVVAFRDESAIYTGSGGMLSRVVEGEIGTPSINSSGAIAFVGASAGVYVWRNGGTEAIATADGPFYRFGYLVDRAPNAPINDSGKVAFFATEDSGRNGLYTGPSPVLDAVIRVGDPLFTSSLSQLDQYPVINNRGDVAFRYSLANGMRGIAVARVVPEPGGAAFVACIALVGIVERRSLRRASYVVSEYRARISRARFRAKTIGCLKGPCIGTLGLRASGWRNWR
jgi:hypothetical protein